MPIRFWSPTHSAFTFGVLSWCSGWYVAREMSVCQSLRHITWSTWPSTILATPIVLCGNYPFDQVRSEAKQSWLGIGVCYLEQNKSIIDGNVQQMAKKITCTISWSFSWKCIAQLSDQVYRRPPMYLLYSRTTFGFEIAFPSRSVFSVCTILPSCKVDNMLTCLLSCQLIAISFPQHLNFVSPFFNFAFFNADGIPFLHNLTVPNASVLWIINDWKRAGHV